jgi:hypothetical protein
VIIAQRVLYRSHGCYGIVLIAEKRPLKLINLVNYANVPYGRVAHTGEPPTFAKTTLKLTLLWPVIAYFSPI